MPAWLTRNVRVLSAVSFLQDAASELLYPLLPIYLTVVLGAPPAVVGAVEGAAEGAAAMTKLAAGPLGDRFSKRPLIATGYGMAALGKVMVAAASAWSGVLAGRVVDRLGKGIRGAPRDALLVADIDDAARGRVFGFHRAMDTMGAVVGPLLGLAAYEMLDHQIAPLLWVAVVPAGSDQRAGQVHQPGERAPRTGRVRRDGPDSDAMSPACQCRPRRPAPPCTRRAGRCSVRGRPGWRPRRSR
ncbi:arabinose efflux permease family protein [Mycolicibacterium conceptionense]|uniref:Arabinose efflux permease family protein n=1 Tax=Mycolicibacterium conceptionense TaxID=451644 RepID=A0A0U1DGW6_9MYCO|nr:arabinose efflux permease family protein [Mycolicibacterium conceptionense]